MRAWLRGLVCAIGGHHWEDVDDAAEVYVRGWRVMLVVCPNCGFAFIASSQRLSDKG